MTDDENTNIHTVSVRVPDWLKHCFDDVYDTDAPDYKKLAAVMKDNSALEMTVTDLSDETLDCAATVYCDAKSSRPPATIPLSSVCQTNLMQLTRLFIGVIFQRPWTKYNF